MPLRRIVVAVIAMLAGLLAVPAAAENDGILLRGSKSGWVDVTVYVNTTIVSGDIEMTTKGSYVGFFMAPAPANRDTVGALLMPRVTGATPARIGQSWDLQAGKYRMFLLTDGAAEVFVPIDGQGFRGWTPRGRAPVSLRRLDFSVDPGTPQDTRDVGIRLAARSLVVSAGSVTSSSLTAVEQLSACVSSATSCAASARVPLATVSAAASVIAPAGAYRPSISITRTGGVDAASSVNGAVLVLTIGRQT